MIVVLANFDSDSGNNQTLLRYTLNFHSMMSDERNLELNKRILCGNVLDVRFLSLILSEAQTDKNFVHK